MVILDLRVDYRRVTEHSAGDSEESPWLAWLSGTLIAVISRRINGYRNLAQEYLIYLKDYFLHTYYLFLLSSARIHTSYLIVQSSTHHREMYHMLS